MDSGDKEGGDQGEDERGQQDAVDDTASTRPAEKPKVKPSLLLSDLYKRPTPQMISMRELKGLLALLVEFGGTFGTAAVVLGYLTHVDPFGGFHW
jgi:hypothetical protein